MNPSDAVTTLYCISITTLFLLTITIRSIYWLKKNVKKTPKITSIFKGYFVVKALLIFRKQNFDDHIYNKGQDC